MCRQAAEEAEGLLAGLVEGVRSGAGCAAVGEEEVGPGWQPGDGDAAVGVGDVAVRGDDEGGEAVGLVVSQGGREMPADVVEPVGA